MYWLGISLMFLFLIFTLIRNLYLMDRNTYILLFIVFGLCIIVCSNPFIDNLNINKRVHSFNRKTILNRWRISILKNGYCEETKTKRDNWRFRVIKIYIKIVLSGSIKITSTVPEAWRKNTVWQGFHYKHEREYALSIKMASLPCTCCFNNRTKTPVLGFQDASSLNFLMIVPWPDPISPLLDWDRPASLTYFFSSLVKGILGVKKYEDGMD